MNMPPPPIPSGQSCSKNVPNKLSLSLSLILALSPNHHKHVLLQRDSVEWRWERGSIFCFAGWNAFEVSVTLRTHQHRAQGKVRPSLVVWHSLSVLKVSPLWAMVCHSEKSSQSISPADEYVKWRTVDGTNLKVFRRRTPPAFPQQQCLCQRNASASTETNTTGLPVRPSFKVLLSRSGEIISSLISHLMNRNVQVFSLPFPKVPLLPWLYHCLWTESRGWAFLLNMIWCRWELQTLYCSAYNEKKLWDANVIFSKYFFVILVIPLLYLANNYQIHDRSILIELCGLILNHCLCIYSIIMSKFNMET